MRGVITEKDVAKMKAVGAPTEQKPDDYVAHLAKFVPVEVISFYVAMSAAAATAKSTLPSYETVAWVMFLMGFFATLIFTLATNKRELRPDKIPGVYSKAAISTGAFVVWAFSLGAPFTSISWYHPFYGTLSLAFYTLVAPKIYKLFPA
jgi:4-hydroxybenzoate polyprenyltransferase